MQIPCPECKKLISHTAESCPHCGYVLTREEAKKIKKQQETAQLYATWGIAGVACVLLLMCFSGFFAPAPKPARTPEQIRKDRIELQFSPWDGSHRNLTKATKDALRDPGSFEHVKTVYFDRGEFLHVRMEYRARNRLGGMNVGSVTAKIDMDGNIIQVIDQHEK